MKGDGTFRRIAIKLKFEAVMEGDVVSVIAMGDGGKFERWPFEVDECLEGGRRLRGLCG